MQDRFDKILKEKLTGLSPEFNPSHWNGMEQMLDNGGRRGFLYWTPLILLFSFLTVGALGYYLYFGDNNSVQTAVVDEHMATQEPKNDIETNLLNGSSTSDLLAEKKSMEGNISDAKPRPEVKSKSKSSNKGNTIPERETNINSKSVSVSKKEASHDLPSSTAIASAKLLNEQSSVAKMAADESASTNINQVGGNGFPSDTKSVLSSEFASSNSLVMERSKPLFIASVGKLQLSQIYKSNMSLEDMTSMVDDDQIFLPQSKKVTFSISAVAGMSESYIDQSKFSEPGFTTGVTSEVMFRNTFGISSGILFTNMHYGTRNVTCEDNARYVCPLAYRSTIKALEIPIDLRLNFVQLKRWNFYLSTGISNFIKLKETFGYDLPLQDTIPAQVSPSRSVPFNQSSALAATAEGAFAETATDFSLSDIKRYHLGYHGSIGAEYRMSKHSSIAFQPNFGFSIPQVGIQNKRLFNYGLNAKITYHFGSR